jgi:hypothetical protein
MILLGILLIVFAGIAEHFKDLSEEGKLNGFWDKNHKPMRLYSVQKKYNSNFFLKRTWESEYTEYGKQIWWKIHWLQGGGWNLVPVWIRQYLSFRDGWHLLKFISLNFYALGIVVIFSADWWWYFALRFAFSAPESLLRFLRSKI